MWDPGNSNLGRGDAGASRARGFTLFELLLVVALIAMLSAGAGLALRDAGQDELEREAQRLVALLESARAQSRASGMPVVWRASASGFEFAGLSLPSGPGDAVPVHAADGATGHPVTPWLTDGISVRDSAALTLGPEPIIEPSQIVLRQANRSLRIATDGLRPFAAQAAVADGTIGTGP